jgi:hypothetical protein
LKKKLLLIPVFLACFFTVYFYADNVLQTKTGLYTSMKDFYDIPENSIDVVGVGSSHVHVSVNPMILWQQEGLPSYMLAASSQPFWGAYYYIKECLKYQNPKLIILEAYAAASNYQTFVNPSPSTVRSYAYFNTFFLRMSRDKIEALRLSIDNNRKNILLGFPFYHARRDIVRYDFIKSTMPFMNGYTFSTATAPFETPPEWRSDDYEVIPEIENEYLLKIIALARGENIPLLFIEAPYIITEPDQKKFNYVKKIARENNLNFINYNLLYIESGLDFMTDMSDWNHLNYKGAAKVSKHLASYIRDTYKLEDKRGDPAYASWNVWAEDSMKF